MMRDTMLYNIATKVVLVYFAINPADGDIPLGTQYSRVRKGAIHGTQQTVLCVWYSYFKMTI